MKAIQETYTISSSPTPSFSGWTWTRSRRAVPIGTPIKPAVR